MIKQRIRIEQDRSTGDWLVVEYMRRGWSVRFRGEYDDAHRYAQDFAHDLAEHARVS